MRGITEEEKEFQKNLMALISTKHSRFEILEILTVLINEYAALTGEKGMEELIERYPKLGMALAITMSLEETEKEKKLKENNG